MTPPTNIVYRRILIIDDSESIHGDFDKILVATNEYNELEALDADLFGAEETSRNPSTGFQLTHAMQGKVGFEIVQSLVKRGEIFGAAFVDMRMPPGWDGVETIENLWSVDPDLQVVICTAFTDHSWEEITNRLGQTDNLLVLKKPFDEIEVIQLATSLCEKRRLLELSKQKVDDLKTTVVQQAAELEAAHENAEALIQSISGMLISLDESGRVSRWNSMASETLGVSERDAVGKSFADLDVRWSDPDAVRALVCGNSPIENRSTEMQLTDKNGQSRTLDIRVCSILADPTSRARLILANDITHQKMLQSQLDQALRLESVGQLAAGVAHEINTPMQYIGDNVRYVAKSITRMQKLLELLPGLVDESVSDEQLIAMRHSLDESIKPKKVQSSIEQIPEALTDAIDGVESVSKIVAAMKEFSHPGSDAMACVRLNHVLESTITVARNEWKYVAEVETDLMESLPDVPALASELNQAFLNIMVNAAHAIGDRVQEGRFEKGKIIVSSRVDGDFAHVSIQDNGGGIPANVRDRVLEPFFTTKDVGKGTGQGLAIAHSVIVHKHGGRLSFEVEEDQGTTFHIRIPLEVGKAETQLDVCAEGVA